MDKAFKACATLRKANAKKHSKINEDLEDEFIKNKNNIPMDVDTAMHMLINLSNGKKNKTVPTLNIEEGLQFQMWLMCYVSNVATMATMLKHVPRQ